MALPKLARPGRARRQGSSVHIPGPGATKIQLQISVTRSASFPLPTIRLPREERGRATGCARGLLYTSAAARGSPSRRQRRRPEDGAASPCSPALHLQRQRGREAALARDGRRRLHPDAQETRPPQQRFKRLRGHRVYRQRLRARRPRALPTPRPNLGQACVTPTGPCEVGVGSTHNNAGARPRLRRRRR